MKQLKVFAVLFIVFELCALAHHFHHFNACNFVIESGQKLLLPMWSCICFGPRVSLIKISVFFFFFNLIEFTNSMNHLLYFFVSLNEIDKFKAK